MKFQIRIKPSAQKELNKLPQIIYKKIISAFLTLSDNPFMGKKLEGEFDGHYSYRAWPCRIIYQVRKKELVVLIVAIGHRQGVYK